MDFRRPTWPLYVLIYMFFMPVYAAQNDLKTLLSQVISFREDGKIAIPPHIKHIKLDIGLSYSAPMSQYWLTHEDDLFVFGFEPNPDAVHSIFQGAKKRHPGHGKPLEKKFIGAQFFLIPSALGSQSVSNTTMQFYVTKDDCGCSSLYKPRNMEVEQIVNVPIFSLSDFFDLFPFDTHPVIEYIKIDAQGADLEIAKGAGQYLAEKVVYITLEPENDQYENTVNSIQDINTYMQSIGFVPHTSQDTGDPTYFNPRFTDYIKNNQVKIYQKG